MRTSRYGHEGASVMQVYSAMRRDIKRTDDIVRICSEMANREKATLNETIIYDVYKVQESGDSDIIHTIEVEGKKSI